jgi:hypothetical protein
LLAFVVLGLLGGFVAPTTQAALFGSPTSITLPSSVVALATGDVNNDGKLDLIAASGYVPGVYVMLGNKKGGFGTPTFWELKNGPYFGSQFPILALAVADLNGDGKPDIVTANTFSGDTSFGAPSRTIFVLFNDGKGNFGTGESYSGGANGSGYFEPTASMVVSDVDGSGKPEILVSNAKMVDVWSGMWYLAMTYNAPSEYYGGFNPTKLAVGDANGDGKPDIVAVSGSWVDVLLNQGNGNFAAAGTYVLGGDASAVSLGDVNADGKLDVLTTILTSGSVSVLRGNGDGTFGTAQNYAVAGAPNSIALGDFNADSKLDIVTTGTAEVDVLLNNGDGTFGASQAVGPAGSSVVMADINGDGLPDLAQTDGSGTSVDVILNTSTTGGKGHK